MTRYALFGDIQGHVGPYEAALRALGVDVETGAVPEGVVIIQVGDLVHKGPDSAATIALADRLLTTSPTRYVQLAGNHEGHYLGGPEFWSKPIDPASAVTLAQWYIDGRLQIATSVTIGATDLFISHGGLTVSNWKRLGSLTTARSVAEVLNDEFRTEPAFALRPGRMLMGAEGPPGVAWSEPHDELYQPWLAEENAPFGQVHGHASIVNWRSGRFYRGVDRKLRKPMLVDHEARHTSITLGGQPFYGIDTAYGASEATPVPTPLLFDAG